MEQADRSEGFFAGFRPCRARRERWATKSPTERPGFAVNGGRLLPRGAEIYFTLAK
jgi:hypothetical protein